MDEILEFVFEEEEEPKPTEESDIEEFVVDCAVEIIPRLALNLVIGNIFHF